VLGPANCTPGVHLQEGGEDVVRGNFPRIALSGLQAFQKHGVCGTSDADPCFPKPGRLCGECRAHGGFGESALPIGSDAVLRSTVHGSAHICRPTITYTTGQYVLGFLAPPPGSPERSTRRGLAPVDPSTRRRLNYIRKALTAASDLVSPGCRNQQNLVLIANFSEPTPYH
jgi:hypothetical protein